MPESKAIQNDLRHLRMLSSFLMTTFGTVCAAQVMHKDVHSDEKQQPFHFTFHYSRWKFHITAILQSVASLGTITE